MVHRVDVKQKFRQGTEPGEAAWIVIGCIKALSPLAPALFGRQGLDGSLQIDMGALIDTACAMSVQIQDRAFEMTQAEP